MLKNIPYLLILLFCASLSLSAQTKKPKISFQKTEHNFGSINEADGKAGVTFEFINTGSQPLIIGKVEASCGCTTPSWSKTPIGPGQKGFVKAEYDPTNRPGTFSKTVTVYSNAEDSPFELHFNGEVIPRAKSTEDAFPFRMGDLRLVSNQVSFMKLMNTEARTEKIEMINSGSAAVQIAAVDLPAFIKVSIEPSSLAPKQKGIIKVTYDGRIRKDWDMLTDHFDLAVNGKKDASYRISTTAVLVEDFSKLTPAQKADAAKVEFASKTWNLVNVKSGAKVTYDFKFTNKGKSPLVIRKAFASCGCTVAQYDSKPIAPGKSGSIKVSFDSKGKEGTQNKTVTVISNDPVDSKTILWIKGTVLK